MSGKKAGNILKKALGIILIAAGIFFLAYPKLRVMYYEWQQQKVLEAWQNSLAYLDQEEDSLDYLAGLPTVDGMQASLELKGREQKEAERLKAQAEYLAKNTEGILKIDKINLYMPILKGVTEKNLNIGLASVENTGTMGEVGNYCVAGHRSRTYGRQFNRLDELEAGDLIEVEGKNATYVYEVTDKMVVNPEDTWVLQGNKTQKLITLVTCDYSQEPYLRLIVRGELVEEKAAAAK